MRVSKLAKVASIALAFGLVATTPAYAANLSGSGGSFPANLIEACKAPFAEATSHTFTYAASGSSTGRSNSDRGNGDFWMTDGAHVGSSRRSTIIHVPLVAAPIAIMHNLPGKKTLQLSAETIAKTVGPLLKCDFLICGPRNMMLSLRDQLQDKHVRKSNIHYEEFTFA